MLCTNYEVGCKVEDILSELMQDANSGTKQIHLYEACTKASDYLSDLCVGRSPRTPQLRESCFLPFKIALEAKSSKLPKLAVTGLQALITDERFHSEGHHELIENQIPGQLLNAIVSTPLLTDEVQEDIMKLLLEVTTSDDFWIHPTHLIKITEMCLETYKRAQEPETKSACKVTLTKMLSFVCHKYQENLPQKTTNYHTAVSAVNKSLGQTVNTLLKDFCAKLNTVNCSSMSNVAHTLYLESIQVMMANLSPSVQQDKDFLDVIWQVLCPALVQLLGLPSPDGSCRGKPIGFNGFGDGVTSRGLNGRNTTNSTNRAIYSIAIELVRLVGGLSSLRSTLESLFHRIIIYPPVNQRGEALRSIKEMLSSPQIIFDLAGPTEVDPASPDSAISRQQKSDLDLFQLIVDGIQEASSSSEVSTCSVAASCIVTLLGTLEDISEGRGLTNESTEKLSKVPEPENWQELYGKAINDSINNRISSLKCGNLEDSNTETESDSEGKRRPKHIRWQMDYEKRNEPLGSEDENGNVMTPKSVTWANNHERTVENREQEGAMIKGKSKLEAVRKSSIPKPKFTYARVKSRVDTGLKVKPRKLGRKDNIRSNRLQRSYSAMELRNAPFKENLKRSKSTSILEIHESRIDTKFNDVKVDFGFFDKYRKSGKNEKCKMVYPRLLVRNKPPILEEDSPSEQDFDEKFPSKVPKPILRRRSFNENEKEKPLSKEGKEESTDKKVNQKAKETPVPEEVKLPIKETTINGIPLSKLPREKEKIEKRSAKKAKPKVNKEPDPPPVQEEKSEEELEKEGAQNFARCLLGILPSVLSATEPSVTDEALQQFSSDVCEAVTCLALKRKNVPNFGSIRQHEIKPDEKDEDPSLNADGVYKTVYETLHLSFLLNKSGYYKKKGSSPVSQGEFIEKIIHSGIPVRLSIVWLNELYRLVTTYDILSKAGYKSESSQTNRALVGILSESMYTQHFARFKDTGLLTSNEDKIPPSKFEGIKFARRLLLSTWDQVLDTLAVTLDSNSKLNANATAITAETDDPNAKKQIARERDLVCMSLDGFRKAARLCCTLGIHARCDIILSHLAYSSCGDFFNNKNIRNQVLTGSLKLHAAHVLSMDALLAAGLELGMNAPQAWMHVFKCCIYISHLEHVSFRTTDTSSIATSLQLSLKTSLSGTDDSGSVSDVLNASDSDTIFDSSCSSFARSEKVHVNINGILNADDACKAVYALSNAVDNLFDAAATSLPIASFRTFLDALIDASHHQLFGKHSDLACLELDPQDSESINQQMITMNTLHLYHICDVMLRCARNNNRPLLHVMEAWTIISSHLVEAAYHKARHVSKVALTSIHDILSEMLKRRSELPHFWFYDTLFKPFDTLMGLDLCDDEIQDQILYTLYELVEGFGPSIKSGWRSLFGALSNTQIYHRHSAEEFSDGEQRRKLVFNIFDNFANIKNTNVFASAAVSAVLCLLKFLRGGSTADFEEAYDLKSSEYSETDIEGSGSTRSQNLCEPTLNILSQISKRLSKIYVQPASSIFYGSHSIFLISMTETQDKIWDDTWSQSSSTVSGATSPETDEKANTSNTASSIIAIDDTGILRVWFLLLEGLTNNIASSQYWFQPVIIELLFEILRSITSIPGPHFSMFVISNLVLPMLHSWVKRGSRKKSYWEHTLQNFKHACGSITQLIVEELENFLTVEGASDCVPLLLKQLLDMFQECISQPIEVIARLGCACLRHLLLSAGPQFTEELWNILCEGIKEITDSTLLNLRTLVSCYQPDTTSITGDNGIIVKVVARRDVTPAENLRLMELAKQVFLLESQVIVPSPGYETTDEEDNRSFIFVLISEEDKDKHDCSKTRISFKGLTVSLLANQIITQMLGSILLESAESVRGSIISTITESGLIERTNEDSSLPGLLCYLSPNNLDIIFDCLMQSYQVANDFNNRPGIRSLIQKLAKFSSLGNLLRQSITSFAFYLNTLFQLSRHDGENFSISNIKRILTGEKVSLDVSGSSDIVPLKSEAPKPMVGEKYRNVIRDDNDIDWIVRRLYEACNQISNTYQKLHESDTFVEQDSGFSEHFSSSFSTSSRDSPVKDGSGSANMSEESIDITKSMKSSLLKNYSPFRNKQKTVNASVERNGYETKDQVTQHSKAMEDELLHLSAWSQLIISMLELLLGLPALQFKSVLPAVFPAVTSLITTVHDHKVRQLVCDVVRRCGAIYGII